MDVVPVRADDGGLEERPHETGDADADAAGRGAAGRDAGREVVTGQYGGEASCWRMYATCDANEK
tara:strand:- start:914 stop:1108 length:195 start_codon:yes stop_codon:yes gene_type:complete